MNSTHLDLIPKHITSQIEIRTVALPIQFQHIMGIKHSGFILFLKSDFRQFLQWSVLHVFCGSGESNMLLHASADRKRQNKCAHMRLFWQSTTPCMLLWKKKGVDGRGMVRVRKKASWKQVLSVSLPKAPSRQQTGLPSSSLPSAGRGGMQAVVLGQDLGYWESSRGSAGEEYFHQQFTFLCKGPVTAEIISHLLLLNTI